MYPKPKWDIPFGRSLPVWAIVGSTLRVRFKSMSTIKLEYSIKYSQRDWKIVSHTNCANESQPTSKLSWLEKYFWMNKPIKEYTSLAFFNLHTNSYYSDLRCYNPSAHYQDLK